jgi:hypothetical protein
MIRAWICGEGKSPPHGNPSTRLSHKDRDFTGPLTVAVRARPASPQSKKATKKVAGGCTTLV